MLNVQKYNPIPGGSFRAGQAEAITQLHNNFISGKKQQTLRAPTAAGKTLDLVAFGNILVEEFDIEKVLFTSPMVALVETGNLFGTPKLVGKSNYPCLGMEGCTAEDCLFPGEKTPLWACCDECPYRIAKEKFRASMFGATTFARYMVDPMIKRETAVLLIDESSNLPDAMISSSALEIPKSVFDDARVDGIYDALQDYRIRTLNEAANLEIKLKSTMSELETQPNNKHLIETMKKTRRQLNRLNGIADAAFQAMIYIKKEVPFVLTSEEEMRFNKVEDRWKKTIVHNFKLLDPKPAYEELISNLKMVVLASGTPTTQLLTSDPSHAEVVIQHPIEVGRRLIHVNPIATMNYSEREKNARPMALAIKELHNQYNRNTLVHCGNYKIAELINGHLNGVNVILQNQKKRKEDLLRWMDGDDTIFLSVNYEEGIDLKSDKFMTNIIAKVAFPNLGTEWWKARNKLDGWQWYNIETSVSVMQACGRTTRTPTDYSETYILDASFGGFYNRNRALFPDWFNAALVWP